VLAVNEDDIHALNAALLANPSATAVLQKWCADRHIAEPAVIRAVVDRGALQPASAEQRIRLKIDADEPVAYRRVQLACGGVVLSEAENWYVPARLTPEMNAALAGDTPFGTAIKPLTPSRTTLSTEFEWPGQQSREILRHRALVSGGDGVPLAEVVETYQRTMLKPSH
jgi:hypothetical protein